MIEDSIRFSPEKPGIYSIFVISGNVQYIGSSVNIKKRLIWHINALKRRKHHCRRLQEAFSRFGESAFWTTTKEIIVEKSLLTLKEQAWLNLEKPVLNSTLVAERNGVELPVESKLLISKALKGRKKGPFTLEHRLNLSRAHKGIKMPKRTAAHQAKLSASHIGSKRSQQTIEKMRASRLAFLAKK